MANLLGELKLFFNPKLFLESAPPQVETLPKVFLGLWALFFIASLALFCYGIAIRISRAKKVRQTGLKRMDKGDDERTYLKFRLIQRLYYLFFSIALLGFSWSFFLLQKIPMLSNPLMFIAILVTFFVWGALVLRYWRGKYKEELVATHEVSRKHKYMPRKRKA